MNNISFPWFFRLLHPLTMDPFAIITFEYSTLLNLISREAEMRFLTVGIENLI